MKFHVYNTGQITRTGTLALQARKSTRTTRRSKVKKKLHNAIQLFNKNQYFIIQPIETLTNCLFQVIFVCLFINRSPQQLEAMLLGGSANRPLGDSSKYVNKCTVQSVNTPVKKLQFYIFKFFICTYTCFGLNFSEFFGYSDGENDVIIPHICSLSKAQPCQSPRKV